MTCTTMHYNLIRDWNTKHRWSLCRSGRLNQQTEPKFLKDFGSIKPDRLGDLALVTTLACDVFMSKVVFNLVDDTSSAYKLHDRWLFTQYGGIDCGQGFQRQSRGRKMNV
jgi:hypothetical protein